MAREDACNPAPAASVCGIEVAHLIAVGTSQYVVSYGTPSLAAAVDASIPAYRFVLSLVLYAATRKVR